MRWAPSRSRSGSWCFTRISVGPSSSPERAELAPPLERERLDSSFWLRRERLEGALGRVSGLAGVGGSALFLAVERVGVAGLIERQVAVIDFQGKHGKRCEEEPPSGAGPAIRLG